jgi:hypothetical protein
MNALLEHLPRPEHAYLTANSASILDCGCAFGDGVEVLARAFPNCSVAGLDIARSAIEIARARHPQHEFILSEEGEIPRRFDVVLCSNVLEHFEDPTAIARLHALSSRLLYLILVPYCEYPYSDAHFVTFTEDTFPHFLGGMARLSVTPFDADPAFWTGKQMLVVYASESYLSERASDEREPNNEHSVDWVAYFRSPPELRAVLENLAARCARAETALTQAVVGRLDGQPGQRNLVTLVRNVERLDRLREKWAPRGTLRAKLLSRLVSRLLQS